MNCKNCGASLNEGMTFCPQCGTNNAEPVNQAQQPTGGFTNPQQPTGGFTNPQQQQYYQQPMPQMPKKPLDRTVYGFNWSKISVIVAIIVGSLYVLAGFIGMFQYVSSYGSSVSGIFSTLFNGIANGLTWAVVIVLLGKIVEGITNIYNKKDK